MKYPWTKKKEPLKTSMSTNHHLIYRHMEFKNKDDFDAYLKRLIKTEVNHIDTERTLELMFQVFDYILKPAVYSGESLCHKFVDENPDYKRLSSKFEDFVEESMHQKIVDAISGKRFINHVAGRLQSHELFNKEAK